MRIAIASDSTTESSEISQHGARAGYYFLISTENNEFVVLENPAAAAEHAAGPMAAEFLAGQGINQIIAGHFGHKFRMELEANNIECIEQTGTINDVLENQVQRTFSKDSRKYKQT